MNLYKIFVCLMSMGFIGSCSAGIYLEQINLMNVGAFLGFISWILMMKD